MTLKINNINLELDEPLSDIKTKICKKLRISKDSINSFKILRESIDARKKDNIKFNYSVEVNLCDEKKVLSKIKDKDVFLEKDNNKEEFVFGKEKINVRPIVIGLGPAGLFAALSLAQNGYRPIVFERGQDVDSRTKTVQDFWNGISDLNPESNVQFGEGGAGAFSDGKLTTRIKDKRCSYVLKELVKEGAPKEIIYEGKPHVGTDILKDVVKNIREKIKALGGEVYFNSKLDNIYIKDGKIKEISINNNKIPCETLILAIGHSSRDTYEMLLSNSIFMEPKDFAIGVRIEHLRGFINESQYGKFADHPRLKAASYNLAYQSQELKRGIYSFCMCPGGVVVGAASEKNRLVTNGMSYHSRNDENSNSALVVTVSEKDFDGSTPIKGMEFQRKYEELAYNLGGGNYVAPVQLLGDFMHDRKSNKLGCVKPSYKPGYEFKELKECLPQSVCFALKEGIQKFDQKIKGYGMDDAVLTGVETRTSAPVKITRTRELESISASGLYPAGEGAGFAGGIISAAVDGIKVAESIMKKYARP